VRHVSVFFLRPYRFSWMNRGSRCHSFTPSGFCEGPLPPGCHPACPERSRREPSRALLLSLLVAATLRRRLPLSLAITHHSSTPSFEGPLATSSDSALVIPPALFTLSLEGSFEGSAVEGNPVAVFSRVCSGDFTSPSSFESCHHPSPAKLHLLAEQY
jgi:hypothetical protein